MELVALFSRKVALMTGKYLDSKDGREMCDKIIALVREKCGDSKAEEMKRNIEAHKMLSKLDCLFK